jgi:hypothetical protein
MASVTRHMSALEAAVFDRLLAVEFPGSNEIREQLRFLRVRELDADGSLELRSTEGPNAVVRHRVPVEAHMLDRDGTPIHVLLHVVDGRARELEVYKADGSRILDPIDPNRLQVTQFGSE